MRESADGGAAAQRASNPEPSMGGASQLPLPRERGGPDHEVGGGLSRPVQLGMQFGSQVPLSLQRDPGEQEPQAPPHPLSPHSRPSQSGVQVSQLARGGIGAKRDGTAGGGNGVDATTRRKRWQFPDDQAMVQRSAPAGGRADR